MRARLLALSILWLILSIPLAIYWFFSSQYTSSLILTVDADISFSLRLEGDMGQQRLPLMDQLLVIERECMRTCTISPIAPIGYTLTITSPGKITITDQIRIETRTQKQLSYQLSNELILDPYNSILGPRSDIARDRMSQIDTNNPTIQYNAIGMDSNDNIYAERSIASRRDIGIISTKGFVPIYTLPDTVDTVMLDKTWQYILLRTYQDSTIVLSLDGIYQDEIPITHVNGYVQNDNEVKVYTTSWTYLWAWGRYSMNIRFTDWIDLPGSMRIWYIAAEDTERLSLSDLPLGQWVLVAVDRKTGVSHIVKRWIDIVALFYVDSIPILLDSSGKAWNITL